MDIIAQHHPTYPSYLYGKNTLFSSCKKISTHTRCCIQPRCCRELLCTIKFLWYMLMHALARCRMGCRNDTGRFNNVSKITFTWFNCISTVLCGSLTASTELWLIKMKNQRNVIVAVLKLRLETWQFWSVGLFGHSGPVWNISTTITWTRVSPVDETSWL